MSRSPNCSNSTTPSSWRPAPRRPAARHSGRRPARRGRLGGVRRLVQRPSRLCGARPPLNGPTQQSSATAMSRSSRPILAKTGRSSQARTSSATRSTRSTSGHPHHHHPRPPRPASDRDDAQGASASSAISTRAAPGVDPADFPPRRRRRRARARPAQIGDHPARLRRAAGQTSRRR